MWVATERSYRLTQTPFKSAKNVHVLLLANTNYNYVQQHMLR